MRICIKKDKTVLLFALNPFQSRVAFQIETSRLFFKAKQVIGFYMKRNTEVKWVKRKTASYIKLASREKILFD